MADARLGFIGPLLGAIVACGSPPPAAFSAAPAKAQLAAPVDFEGGRWGSFRSKRFRLELPLPDGRVWRIDDHKTPWLTASHAPTQSELWVRTWHEYERANTKTCEEKARLWKKEIPSRDGAEIVEHRAIGVPEDFDTWVDIGIAAAPAPGDPIRAFAIAFGGRRHQCFTFVYMTRAHGPGAERVIAARLAVMVQKSLGKVVASDSLHPAVRGAPDIKRSSPEPGAPPLVPRP
jgi:hypothetical protein